MEKIIISINKNFITFILGLMSSPIIQDIGKYIYDDWDFFKFLLPLILMDTFLGVAKNFRNKTLSSTAWGKILWKLISYAFIMVLAHIVTHFTVDGKIVSAFSWFDETIYSAIIIKECISILENITAINPNLIPKWIVERLKSYDSHGKFDSNNKCK